MGPPADRSRPPGISADPLVISFAEVPRITNRDTASKLPQLAVLSVMAHPELKTAEIGLAAISGLPEHLLRLYTDVILKALPAELRQILEARMIKGYQYQSDFARKYYGQGREEGLRAAVVALARTKIESLSDADVAAIEAVSDQHILTDLVTSLGQARSARKARAALDRALHEDRSAGG